MFFSWFYTFAVKSGVTTNSFNKMKLVSKIQVSPLLHLQHVKDQNEGVKRDLLSHYLAVTLKAKQSLKKSCRDRNSRKQQVVNFFLAIVVRVTEVRRHVTGICDKWLIR